MAKAKKLFGSTDRDAAHRELERVLAEGTWPRASCREDPNDSAEPFTVWTDNPEPHVLPPAPVEPAGSEEELLDRLADKLLARIEAKAVKTRKPAKG